MSKNKTINTFLKKTAKNLDKTRNPFDKITSLSCNTRGIAYRVVRDSIVQAKNGADSLVNVSTRRLRSARDEEKLKDILRAQVNSTAADARIFADIASDSLIIVADGLVDACDEVSQRYQAYRIDSKAGVANSTSTLQCSPKKEVTPNAA